MNFSKYKGIGKFGPAYKIMLENDIHADGSVDRVIVNEAIQLCPETAGYLYSAYTPLKAGYRTNSRPILEKYLRKIVVNAKDDEEKIDSIAGFCKNLTKRHAVLFGGTEEEIIESGSDWCTDLARVGCVLFQIAGFPSRLVHLADTDKAYSMHEIVEVYRNNKWGAVDTTYGIVYQKKNGCPLSVWDIMNGSSLMKVKGEIINQFKSAAISNYFAKDFKKYNYKRSRINGYYRTILEMASKGWPGGIRWLYGEDKKYKKRHEA